MDDDEAEAAHQRYLVQTEKEQNDAKCSMLEQELERARVRMAQVSVSKNSRRPFRSVMCRGKRLRAP